MKRRGRSPRRGKKVACGFLLWADYPDTVPFAGDTAMRRPVPPILQSICRLTHVSDNLTCDAELLGRFTASRDEIAFAVILKRHAPLVWGVCRRWLRDPHAAEDVF